MMHPNHADFSPSFDDWIAEAPARHSAAFALVILAIVAIIMEFVS